MHMPLVVRCRQQGFGNVGRLLGERFCRKFSEPVPGGESWIVIPSSLAQESFPAANKRWQQVILRKNLVKSVGRIFMEFRLGEQIVGNTIAGPVGRSLAMSNQFVLKVGFSRGKFLLECFVGV